MEAGDGLLSHALAGIVPSALTGLTAVFGMGTGVAPSRWSPAKKKSLATWMEGLAIDTSEGEIKLHGRLVRLG